MGGGTGKQGDREEMEHGGLDMSVIKMSSTILISRFFANTTV